MTTGLSKKVIRMAAAEDPPVEGCVAVFGASSGIGLATAEALTKSTTVVALSRREPSGAVGAGGIRYIACDVRDNAQVTEFFRSHGDRVTAVVNCAGVGAYAPLGDDFAEYWKEIVETNLLGCAHILSNVLRFARNCRHVIAIGSLAAYRASATPGNDMYSASKAGMARCVKDFRLRLREAGNPMRVTLLTPGFVEGTGFGEHFFRSQPDATQDLFAEFGGLRPTDVADVIEWCLTQPAHVDVSEVVVRPLLQTN